MHATPRGYRVLPPLRWVWPYWQGSSVPLYVHFRLLRDGVQGTYGISVAGRGVGGGSLPPNRGGRVTVRVDWPKGVALEGRGNQFIVTLATIEDGKESTGDYAVFAFQAPETEQAYGAFIALVLAPALTFAGTVIYHALTKGPPIAAP